MGVRNAVLSTFGILSAILMAMPSPSVLAQERGDRAGVSAAVYGNVQLSRVSADIVGRKVASGEDILLGDAIRSEPDSGMQILLLDQTVFTIGPASEITVDTFVYDPSDGAGKVAVSVSKGAFRFVTGLIAQDEPENMTVNLPHGTIGIRGTIVAGRVGADTSEVILLGPGDEASTNERTGRIEVSNAAGSVAISRTGYATTVSRGTAPALPYLAPANRVNGLLSAVNGEGDPEGEGEDDAAEDGTAEKGDGQSDEETEAEGESEDTQSGDTETAADGSGGNTSTTEGSTLQLTGSIGGESVTTLASTTAVEVESDVSTTSSTQETQAETESASSTTEVVANTLGELTTLQDLQTITSGIGVIAGKAPLISVDAQGEFAFKGTFDFGAQTAAFDLAADWTTAAFANDGLGVGTDVLLRAGPEPYSKVFESSDVIDQFAEMDPFDSANQMAEDEEFFNLGPNEQMKVFIRLRNGETEVAKFLDVDVRIDDDGLFVHSDGIVTGTR